MDLVGKELAAIREFEPMLLEFNGHYMQGKQLSLSFCNTKGTVTKSLLERIKNTTSEMLQEQEVVRGRIFTIQDVLQSTVRACLEFQGSNVEWCSEEEAT
ncbi:uncharacterized protein LOC110032431 [Phalaenopsis equestris]|uniref:uncharacterized protein LOC110032431 n=1 Tax=Phalaenopsis equestris TaxID=78828 RepID=UPI0009E5EFBA|nr:uncharacterized protein LOC110032431 [Phalaenopsis equestris]